MTRSESVGGLNASVDSDETNFFVPEFGYNCMIRPDLSFGITVYGNGGMNTTYPGGQLNCGMGTGTANVMCGSGTLGQDMMQLIIAPTLRAGYNHGGNPIGASDVTFNIIAPGVVTDHFTLGFTQSLPDASELTLGFMYAPKKSVSGASAFNAFYPSIPSFGGNETIRMNEYSLGIGYSKRF